MKRMQDKKCAIEQSIEQAADELSLAASALQQLQNEAGTLSDGASDASCGPIVLPPNRDSNMGDTEEPGSDGRPKAVQELRAERGRLLVRHFHFRLWCRRQQCSRIDSRASCLTCFGMLRLATSLICHKTQADLKELQQLHGISCAKQTPEEVLILTAGRRYEHSQPSRHSRLTNAVYERCRAPQAGSDQKICALSACATQA